MSDIIVDRDENGNVIYDEYIYNDGQILEAEHMNRIETYIKDIYEVLNAKPKIIFFGENSNEIISGQKFSSYSSVNQNIYLNFQVEARGNINVAVYQGSSIVFAEADTASRDFNILVEQNVKLPGNRTYRVEVKDNLNNKEVRIVEHTIIMSTLEFSNKNKITKILSYPNNTTNTVNLIADDQKIIAKIFGETIDPNPKLFYSLDEETWIQINDNALVSSEGDHFGYQWDFPNIEKKNIQEFELVSVFFKMEYKKASTIIPTQMDMPYQFYLVEENTIKVIIDTNLDNFNSNEAVNIKARLLIPDSHENFYTLNYILYKGNEIYQEFSPIITKLNEVFNINLGMLPAIMTGEAEYKIKWICDNKIDYSNEFVVHAGSQYAQNGLIAYFSAENFNEGDEWVSLVPLNSEIENDASLYYPSIKLFGGYNKVNKTEGVEPAHINFIPNSYGYFNQHNDILYNNLNNNEGFAIELFCKSKNIGEIKAPIFSSNLNETVNTDGLILYYNKLYVKKAGIYSTFEKTIPINEWNHIVINVIAQTDKFDSSIHSDLEIEEQRKYSAIEIYLNGCLIGTEPLIQNGGIATWAQFFNNEKGMILNTVFNQVNNTLVEHSGHSQISLIRLYNQPLLPTKDIFLNYKQCINYDSVRLSEFEARQQNNSIAQVFFVSRHGSGKEYTKNNKKIENYIDFEKLHKITVKKASELTQEEKQKYENLIGGSYYSKNSAVNCVIYIMQTDISGKNIIHCQRLGNADVLLQGTSSLLYPIKNYQIMNYEELEEFTQKGNKKSFLPDVEEVDNEEGIGWNGVNGDYIYTLKCDYMEQSHKNNTPTAMYYDTVLDNVITTNHPQEENKLSFYSPAKQYRDKNDKAIYRDSIQGFPTLTYYTNQYEVNEKIEDETYTYFYQLCDYYYEQQDYMKLKEKLQNQCVNTGSYMFNIDKEGAALGFDLKEDSGETETFNFPLRDWYIKTQEYVSSTDEEATYKVEFEENDNDFIGLKNNNETLFLFNYDDDYNIVDIGEINTIDTEDDKFIIKIKINNDDFDYSTIKLFCISQMKMGIQHSSNNICVSLEGTANTQDPAAGTFFTANEANQADKKLSYYEKTLEPRYSISPKNVSDEQEEEWEYYCNYKQLDKTIKFFKLVEQRKNEANANEGLKSKMKAKFESLFSLDYCLTYYLQMLVFTQIDNSGKNAMYDCWNNGKFYPRPYDMDTQMGLDNVGKDRIPVSAELHDSSNISLNNIANNPCNAQLLYQNKEILGDSNLNYYRLNSTYNSTNSRLWNFIFNYYYADLKYIYETLRNKTNAIYSAETIFNFVKNKTTKVISEKQYNLDAYLKYLSLQNDTSFFYEVNGNRDTRYKQFLEERLIFLDSVFEIDEFSNYDFNWRPGETGDINLVFSSLTPQYIRIIAGNTANSQMKFFISPDFLYDAVNIEGQEPVWKEGISLLYNNGGNPDVDTQIKGVKNLKFISNFGSSKPKSITGGTNDLINLSQFDLIAPSSSPNILLDKLELGAEGHTNYLNSFVLENFDKIENLSFNSADYIKKIKINNCKGLVTVGLPPAKDADGNAKSDIQIPLLELNLQNNENLQTLNLQNFPNLVVDSYYDVNTKETITSVMNSIYTTGLNLYGCKKISNIVIKNCPLLSNLDFSELENLESVVIDNCDNLTEFSCPRHLKLKSLIIKNCKNLKDINLTESKLTTLDLSVGNNNLKNLILNGSNLLTSLELPVGITLTKLNLKSCTSLQTINSTTIGVYDFTNINIEGELRLQETPVQKIIELNYQGIGSYFCASCTKLESFDYDDKSLNSIIISNSGYQMFYRCTNLVVPSSNRLKHTDDTEKKVTNLIQAFDSCKQCDLSSLIKTFITNNSNLTSISYAFSGCKNLTSTTLDLREFTGLNNLETMHQTFAFTNLSSILQYAMPPAPNLTAVSAMFFNTFITSVPDNLFVNCEKINNARYCFANTPIESVGNQIFSNLNTSPIIDISNIFQNCTSLITGAVEFFNNNLNIGIADGAFMNTGITTLVKEIKENGKDTTYQYIFDATTKLSSAIGLFSECLNLTNLPIYLKSTTDSPLTVNSINLSGLFYNCINMAGAIPTTLFDNLRDKIVSLGSGKLSNGSDDPTKCRQVLGAFCNTKIESYTGAAFQNLTQLKYIDYLFAQVVLELISNANRNYTYQLQPQEDLTKRYFKGYTGSTTNALGENMFSGCKSIEKITGCFMGTLITKIETSESNDSFYFGGSQTSKVASSEKISNIDFLFTNSPLEYTEALNNRLCQYFTNVTKAKYAFTQTNLTNDSIYKILPHFISLENAAGMFSNCSQIQGELNNDIFNGLTNIENLDYMFAKTQLTSIQDNQPNSIIINGVLIIIDNSDNSYIISYEENNLKLDDTIITSFGLSEDGKLRINNEDATRDVIKQVKLSFLTSESGLKGQTYSFYAKPLSLLTQDNNFYLFDKTIETVEAVNNNYQYTITIYNSQSINDRLPLNYLQWYNQIIALPTTGLFFNNQNTLASIKGMFAHTPLTIIPKYLFSSQENKSFDQLTNISYLFNNCVKCKETSEQEFLPSSWLNNCNNINTIEGIFTNLGAQITYSPGEVEITKDLGTAFNRLANLQNAKYAFAGIPYIIKNTKINSAFLENSVQKYKLSNIQYVFANSKIDELNNPFSSMVYGSKNTIKNLNHAFASTGITSTTVLVPLRSVFPTTLEDSAKNAWSYSSNLNLSGRGWAPSQYQWENNLDINTNSNIQDFCNNILVYINGIASWTNYTNGITS